MSSVGQGWLCSLRDLGWQKLYFNWVSTITLARRQMVELHIAFWSCHLSETSVTPLTSWGNASPMVTSNFKGIGKCNLIVCTEGGEFWDRWFALMSTTDGETKVHKNAPILFLLQPNGAIAASCPVSSIFRSAGFPQAWPDVWHFHNTPIAFWLLRVVPLLRTHLRQSFPGVPPCQSLVN